MVKSSLGMDLDQALNTLRGHQKVLVAEGSWCQILNVPVS